MGVGGIHGPGVGLDHGRRVGEGTGEGVGVVVAVGAGVTVGVGAGVTVGVGRAVGIGVTVGSGVSVGVAVGVAAGAGLPQADSITKITAIPEYGSSDGTVIRLVNRITCSLNYYPGCPTARSPDFGVCLRSIIRVTVHIYLAGRQHDGKGTNHHQD